MMGFIHLLVFKKTQILTDDHKEIGIQNDSHKKRRFSQIIKDSDK